MKKISQPFDSKKISLNFQRQRQTMARRETAENDGPWLKNKLATFYSETNIFKKPRMLLGVAHEIQLHQKVAPQRAITYLVYLKRLITTIWCGMKLRAREFYWLFPLFRRPSVALQLQKGEKSHRPAASNRYHFMKRWKNDISKWLEYYIKTKLGKKQRNLKYEFLLLKEEKVSVVSWSSLDLTAGASLLLTWKTLLISSERSEFWPIDTKLVKITLLPSVS